MPRPTRWSAPAPALALVVVVGLTGACGSDPARPDPSTGSASQGASKAGSKAGSKKACRDQWHDVAETVLGLDQDTDPSALASRWTSVIATIDYYETAATVKDCQQTIEAQVRAISALRQFSQRLRPYDMAYQLRQVGPPVALYLGDPLPAPTRDETGKLVRPPRKRDVDLALRQLQAYAATADADLQTGWRELASVDLGGAVALRTALSGLDQLAQDSEAWQRSERALQVIVAAIHAQESAS